MGALLIKIWANFDGFLEFTHFLKTMKCRIDSNVSFQNRSLFSVVINYNDHKYSKATSETEEAYPQPAKTCLSSRHNRSRINTLTRL